jgi:hypothetical protein
MYFHIRYWEMEEHKFLYVIFSQILNNSRQNGQEFLYAIFWAYQRNN